MIAVHLDDPYTGYLTPDSELEEIELGDRPSWSLLMWDLVGAYSTAESRERAAVSEMIGDVAQGARDRRVSFPDDWLPIDLRENP